MNENTKLAHYLANLCLLSYKNEILSDDDYIFIQRKNCCCILKEDQDYIYCAFRGTDELKDLETYFDYNQCEDICNQVCHYLKNRNKQIILTGHSIGGLIAQICSNKLTYFDDEGLCKSLVYKIVTFGSPKSKMLILPLYERWINGKDVIADLPFNILNNGQLYFLRRHKWKFWRNDHSIKSYIKNIKEYRDEYD